MKQYIVRRVGYSLVSLFLLSLTIFVFVRLTGDPASLLVEPGASEADLQAIRVQFGLDQPIWMQYWQFIASFLTGDLGSSFYYRTPVLDLYFQRLPNSLLDRTEIRSRGKPRPTAHRVNGSGARV